MVSPIHRKLSGRGEGFGDKNATELTSLTQAIIAIELGHNTRTSITKILPKPSWDNKYRKALQEQGIITTEKKGKEQTYHINWKELTKQLFETLIKNLEENKKQLITIHQELKLTDSRNLLGIYTLEMKKDFDELVRQETRLKKHTKDKTYQRDKLKKIISQRIVVRKELQNFKDIYKELNHYLKEYDAFLEKFKKYAETFKDQNKINWLSCLVSSYFETIYLFMLVNSDITKEKEGFTLIQLLNKQFESVAQGEKPDYNVRHFYNLDNTKKFMDEFKEIALPYTRFNRGFESVLITLPQRAAYYEHLEQQMQEEIDRRNEAYFEKYGDQ